MHLGISAYHVQIAPDQNTDALALVAEIDEDVAGYLEAQLLAPLESARWQAHPDLFQPSSGTGGYESGGNGSTRLGHRRARAPAT